MPKQRNATRPAAKTAKKNPVKPQTSLARVRGTVSAPVSVINAGSLGLMERPNPNNIDAALHTALQGAFQPFQIVRFYRALMVARRVYVNGAGKKITAPDHGVRLGALKDYMDRVQGKPIERSLTIRAEQPQTPEALLEEARKSPAMLDTLIDGLIVLREQMQTGAAWDDPGRSYRCAGREPQSHQ